MRKIASGLAAASPQSLSLKKVASKLRSPSPSRIYTYTFDVYYAHFDLMFLLYFLYAFS